MDGPKRDGLSEGMVDIKTEALRQMLLEETFFGGNDWFDTERVAELTEQLSQRVPVFQQVDVEASLCDFLEMAREKKVPSVAYQDRDSDGTNHTTGIPEEGGHRARKRRRFGTLAACIGAVLILGTLIPASLGLQIFDAIYLWGEGMGLASSENSPRPVIVEQSPQPPDTGPGGDSIKGGVHSSVAGAEESISVSLLELHNMPEEMELVEIVAYKTQGGYYVNAQYTYEGDGFSYQIQIMDDFDMTWMEATWAETAQVTEIGGRVVYQREVSPAQTIYNWETGEFEENPEADQLGYMLAWIKEDRVCFIYGELKAERLEEILLHIVEKSA